MPQDIEQVLLSPLVTAPDRGTPIPSRFVAPERSAYESLIGKLFAFRASRRQNVILAVSALPGEGASTVARNTAAVLGGSPSERVVLVDANLRAPSQHTALDIESANGLTDVLTGDVTLGSAVIHGLKAGLSLLASGRSTENPQYLLAQSLLRDTVSTLRAEFDWVIIDGPPVTTYPDAACLADASDGALLVLRAESTRWEVAEEAKNILLRSGIDIVCAVLNRRRHHIPELIYRRL